MRQSATSFLFPAVRSQPAFWALRGMQTRNDRSVRVAYVVSAATWSGRGGRGRSVPGVGPRGRELLSVAVGLILLPVCTIAVWFALSLVRDIPPSGSGCTGGFIMEEEGTEVVRFGLPPRVCVTEAGAEVSPLSEFVVAGLAGIVLGGTGAWLADRRLRI